MNINGLFVLVEKDGMNMSVDKIQDLNRIYRNLKINLLFLLFINKTYVFLKLNIQQILLNLVAYRKSLMPFFEHFSCICSK